MFSNASKIPLKKEEGRSLRQLHGIMLCTFTKARKQCIQVIEIGGMK